MTVEITVIIWTTAMAVVVRLAFGCRAPDQTLWLSLPVCLFSCPRSVRVPGWDRVGFEGAQITKDGQEQWEVRTQTEISTGLLKQSRAGGLKQKTV